MNGLAWTPARGARAPGTTGKWVGGRLCGLRPGPGNSDQTRRALAQPLALRRRRRTTLVPRPPGRPAGPAPRPQGRVPAEGQGGALRACALGLRTALRRREQAAPRDRCPYPRWRPRPGLTGSPLQPAPQPPLARSVARPALTAGPCGAALWGRRTKIAWATARVDSHHPPVLPTLSQQSRAHQLVPGASSDSSAPGIGSFGSQWGPGGGRGRSIPGIRRALGLASWRPRGRWAGPSRAVPATPQWANGRAAGRPGRAGRGRGRAVIDELFIRNRAGGRGPRGEVMQGWCSQWPQGRRREGGAGAADGRRS